MKLNLASLFLCTVLALTFSSAQAAACASQMTPTLAELLANEGNAQPIPIDVQAVMRAHSISQLAREHDGGRFLHFEFLNALYSNWLPKQYFPGEGIQGLTVKRYLEFIFPAASFGVADSYGLPEGRQVVQYYIYDQAETSMSPREPPNRHTVLDMTILKSGDPGLNRFERSRQRHLWGIESRKKLIVIYASTPTVLYQQVARVLEQVKTVGGFDHVIVSIGNGAFERNQMPQVISNFFTDFATLSSLVPQALSRMDSALIYNDTTGLMPQIYAAADLTIVIGPVNFFEPLNQSTPTISLLPGGLLAEQWHYNTSRLMALQTLALRTRGFATAYSVGQLSTALPLVLNGEPPVSPALIPGPTSKSPFSQVLDRLEVTIRAQTRAP